MALLLNDFIDGLRGSRSHFLKHLIGLTPEQWVWKPYPECKSITETAQHLLIDDLAALDALKSGAEPDYDSFTVIETEPDALVAALKKGSSDLIEHIKATYKDADLETPVSAWGKMLPLAVALGYWSSEDYYHAGQVAYIRMATDPKWDYYATIYG
jgi:hypothetical protein